MSKKIISVVLSIAMALALVIPAFAVEMPRDSFEQIIIINEYDAYKSNCSGKEGQSIKSSQNLYLEALKNLTVYTSDELAKIGYSDGNIEIIDRLREDPDYTPSDFELARASATLTLSVSLTGKGKTSTNTYADFKWEYNWDSVPTFYSKKDAVGFKWSGDFIMHENYVTAKIRYGSSGVYKTVDYSNDMKLGIDPANHGAGFTFKLNESMTALGGGSYDAFAFHGEGTFRLRCTDHAHNSVQISWSYGHTIITITGISISFDASISGLSAGAGINFSQGVEKRSPGIKTFDL